MDNWGRVFGIQGSIYDFIRVSLLVIGGLMGILMLTPFLGGKLVPTKVKVATAIALSLLIIPSVRDSVTTKLPDIGFGLLVYATKEVFIGAVIGYVGALLFNALETAGQFLDTARGASMASVLIPQLEESGPIFAQLNVQLGIVLFLLIGAHPYFLPPLFPTFPFFPSYPFPSP